MDIKPSAFTNLQVSLPVTSDPATLARLYAPGRILTGMIEAVTQQTQTNQSGTLFQVLINAEGKQINTQSNQPFSVGQTVKLEVMKDGSLRVLQILLPASEQQQNLLQQGLRQALPFQQDHSALLNRLNPLQNLLTLLNRQGENQALIRLQHQINELLTTQTKREELQNPLQLKRAISNSGSFLEAKLQRILQQLTPTDAQTKFQAGLTKLPTGSSQRTPGAESRGGQSITQELPINEILKKNAPLIKQLEGLIGKDLKAQLGKLAATLAPLAGKPGATASATAGAPVPATNSTETQLIQRIIQTAAQAARPGAATPEQSSGGLRQIMEIPQLTITPHIQQILQQAGLKVPNNQATLPREAFDLAVSTLLRQIASSIAKIQTNQFSSLAGQQTTADSPVINSWHAEIPVFSEGQFRPIQLQIDEERTQEQPQDAKQGRQWKITLGFDFAELGEFFATLTIIENTVSTTFWSERPQTLERIRHELNILEQSLKSKGLEVTQIKCRKGRPPSQDTRLDQQLVDIKT